MSWHYRAKRQVVDGEVEVFLVEVYPSLKKEGDTVIPHTENPAVIIADSKEELATWLRLAADDVERFEVIEDE